MISETDENQEETTEQNDGRNAEAIGVTIQKTDEQKDKPDQEEQKTIHVLPDPGNK